VSFQFARVQTRSMKAATIYATHRGGRWLQRKCCEGKKGHIEECEDCRKKRLSLQRMAVNAATRQYPLHVVHEVLSSSGQPLDPGTRIRMESRFREDFGQVRIHADSKAAESARSMGALAYTVGTDIVFDAQQYAPATERGRKLLTHELIHVIQQRGKPSSDGAGLLIGPPNDICEQQAEQIAATPEGLPINLESGTNCTMGLLQRQQASDQLATRSGTGIGKVVGSAASENDCSGWQRDQESISKVAAEHYLRTELGLGGAVQAVECDPGPVPYACHVTFSHGVIVTVIVQADHISVNVSPTGRRIPAYTPFCTYSYKCPPSGELILSKIRCT
jgi:hypothetical protein